jgi:hypothetical protein
MAISLITTLSVNAQTSSPGQQFKSASRTAEAGVVRIRVIGGQQRIDGDDVNSLVTTGIVISDTGEVLTSEFALQGNPDAVFVETPWWQSSRSKDRCHRPRPPTGAAAGEWRWPVATRSGGGEIQPQGWSVRHCPWTLLLR